MMTPPAAATQAEQMPAPKRDVYTFLKSGKYLPDFMQDFHAAKLVFKSVDEMVERAKERDSRAGRMMDYPNWIMAHVYVVDIFLWYMAKHGYTLQRTRAKVEFLDIEETLEDYRRREMEALAKGLLTLPKNERPKR